ncbi:unnamed protein product [Phytophthora fragariaefolia]|uniref:Unnamed protein product n=1 Tax=Phytophthora fragariaefolia TaxID=1490495 RepID=A0A9W6XZ99_9STRA|nr:unnamed protein product [Phytophthora fragariaefolia]
MPHRRGRNRSGSTSSADCVPSRRSDRRGAPRFFLTSRPPHRSTHLSSDVSSECTEPGPVLASTELQTGTVGAVPGLPAFHSPSTASLPQQLPPSTSVEAASPAILSESHNMTGGDPAQASASLARAQQAFAFHARTMAYDYTGMEAHTCRSNPILRGPTTNGDDHSIDISQDMIEEVDRLAIDPDLTQKQIWMAVVEKFYMKRGAPVRGLSENVVKNRVQNARGGNLVGARINIVESMGQIKVKGSHQRFFLV